ncbi:TPA: glycosyltransferase family 2 protein [Neisseria weaveri]|uniref:LgtD n=2 Tax=Neisseria weaveri TaxID=28091 RepID=A0A3S5A8M1_9NEIS|nr:glycosyltransferase family 2 protein [Neisseria weaveri]EGV38579.1 hypothetical protein l11_03810 [Neisseria weaveri LMG 5135]SAY51289.1 LgtD [Neisseria weaveri]VEJ50180.1 LgtD [Neisseria weaveri]
MKRMPLVSVLITAYNVEAYIEESVTAVLNQTYPELEIIVVDDGSTDQTGKLLDGLAQKDRRLKVIHNPTNLGIIKSANIGLAHVNGEYVARTDSDDITMPEWIETLLGIMEASPDILAVSSPLICMAQDGKLAEVFKRNGWLGWNDMPILHEDIIKAMISSGNVMSHTSALIRRTVFSEFAIRYNENYQCAEDFKLWVDISKVGKLHNYHSPLAYYRLHSTQTSSQFFDKQFETASKIRKECIANFLVSENVRCVLPAVPAYHDVKHLELEINRMAGFSEEKDKLFQNILYVIYMSLPRYRLVDLFDFGIRKHPFLSSKQFSKICKKFLRPWKYKKII